MHGVIIHAPVRGFLSDPVQLDWDLTIDPGKVFDLALAFEDVVEGHRAMDENGAAELLLQPKTIENPCPETRHYRLGTPR